MTCTFTKLPGGFMVTCTRGSRPRARCESCRQNEHGFLCDFELHGEKVGQTCSRKLCESCAESIGDLDYCSAHAGVVRRRATEAQEKALRARAWLDDVKATEDAPASRCRCGAAVDDETELCGECAAAERDAADVPIAEKVAHVRAATQDRDHGCHWPGCKRQCKPAYWGCREHWYTLPARIRDKIWRTYAPGQEQDMSPSSGYLDAAREAQLWIRGHIDALGDVASEPRKTSWEEATRRARDADATRRDR